MGIPVIHFRPTVLQGTWICGEKHNHDVRFIGSVEEIMQVAQMLGLEPPETPLDISAAPGDDNSTVFLSDSDGSLLTWSMAERASDVIQGTQILLMQQHQHDDDWD